MSLTDINELQAIVRKYLGSTCVLVLSKNFGASNKDYRHKIRETISSKFPSEDPKIILDLNTPPPINQLSISHSKHLGGYFYNPQSSYSGFDIEVAERATEKIVLRISSESEVKLAPNLTALWGAKEASFKAINRSNSNIEVLSQIHIHNWQCPEDSVYLFSSQLNNASKELGSNQATEESKKSDHFQQGDQKLNGSGLIIQQNVHFFTFYSQ